MLYYDKMQVTITPADKEVIFPRNSTIRHIINGSNTGIKLEIDGKNYEMQPGFNETNIPVSLNTYIKYVENPTLSITFEFRYFFPY